MREITHTPETRAIRRDYVEASTLKRELEGRIERLEDVVEDRLRRKMDAQLIEMAERQLKEAQDELLAVQTQANSKWNEWLDKTNYPGPWRK